ncbi:MAG: PAS domain S-box protein, partial [Candidatus Aminicenantes bacterium]|nr:PAS domain S-box protein [Candidatus Aminicenantes bacterium]
LIISDILMPVMDGFQLCRKVKTDPKFQKIPFIFYTATYTGPKDETFATKIGAERFVIKPCEPKEFLSIIDEVMAENKKSKPPVTEEQPPEEEILKLYSERLIRKLEQKVEQVETEMKARLAAEKATRSNEDNLRITLNSIGDAVIATDLQGRITRMNPVAEKLTGWSFLEAENKPLEEIFLIVNAFSDEKVLNPAAKALETGTTIGLANHTKLISKNGTEYQISDSASPIKDESGEVTGVVLVFRDVTEDYKIRETLKESEDRLCKIMLAANDGMWDWDLKTNKVYFDPRYYQMSGYEIDEFPHVLEEFQKRIHPDDVDYVMNEAEKHLKGEIERFNVKFRFRKKSGEWQWIQGKGIIVERDKKGLPQRFVGTHRDISEIKQAEEKLRSNYALLQIAGETARFGGWDVDLEKYISHWSDTVADIHEMPHGYAPPVEEGINFYAPEWREKITEVFTNCARKGIPYDEEMEIITKSGKRVWVRTIGRAIKDEHGKIIKVQGSFQDISEQKKSEKAQTISELRYRRLFESAKDGILIIDAETGVIMDANPFLIEMLGYSQQEFLGKKVWELGFIKDLISNQDNFMELQQKEYIRYEDMALEDCDGKRHEVEFISNVYLVNNHRVIQCNIRDISERIRIEKKLREMKDNLEIQVAKKTKELQERITELERFHDATIEREFRIKELSDEIERLKREVRSEK